MTYYMVGTKHFMTEDEAKDCVINKFPAVARPFKGGDEWFVIFLSNGPLQPKQQSVNLTADEIQALQS